MRDPLTAWRAMFVRRWHANPDLSDLHDEVGAHSGRCAMLMLKLFPAAPADLLAACIAHDAAEWVVGDLPYSRRDQDFASALDAAEARALADMGLIPPMTLRERAMLKLVDRLDAYLFVRHRRPGVLAGPGWPEHREWLIASARDLDVGAAVAAMLDPPESGIPKLDAGAAVAAMRACLDALDEAIPMVKPAHAAGGAAQVAGGEQPAGEGTQDDLPPAATAAVARPQRGPQAEPDLPPAGDDIDTADPGPVPIEEPEPGEPDTPLDPERFLDDGLKSQVWALSEAGFGIDDIAARLTLGRKRVQNLLWRIRNGKAPGPAVPDERSMNAVAVVATPSGALAAEARRHPAMDPVVQAARRSAMAQAEREKAVMRAAHPAAT